jgi:HicA toxin of bacterial toxin-antitoxin,
VRTRHRKILQGIFAKPDRKNLKWDDFVGLLIELGADITEKGGSMVGVRYKIRYAVFHRPHPGNEIYPTDLKRIRRFLLESGLIDLEEVDRDVNL